MTGPGGLVLEGRPDAVLDTGGPLRIMRLESAKLTAVGLDGAPPGTYRIEALEGSPAAAGITEASEPPDAQVRARVAGRGLRRVLRYDIRRRPAQRVTFVEITADGARRPIGAVDGGTGALRFTTAPGSGRRRIEAQFELDGLPAERRVVASFAAPAAALSRPAALRVRRRGGTVHATWGAVSEAARYEVVATTAAGQQRVVRTRARRAALVGLPRWTGGRVTVRAVAGLRTSPTTGASFRRLERPRTRFRPLPRARRALR